MAPSEAQKRASNKYNLEHMSTLGCKVRKAQAVAFKAYCQNQGSTSNTVLKDFVLGCIGEQETLSQAGESAPGVPLSPEDVKAAQEAAESTGETVPQFIGRAVQTQAQQDKASLSLGINPATGGKIGEK